MAGQGLALAVNYKLATLNYPYFKELAQFIQLGGANGMMVAHSGTALALLFDPAQSDCPEAIAEARTFIESLRPASWFQISNRLVRQTISMEYARLDTPAETALSAFT